MADRTSAEIFSYIFEILAKEPERNEELSKKIWGLMDGYDFHPCQMDCFESLIELGLAREVWNDITEEEEVQYYGYEYP